jgi:hypothetical protein
MDWGASAPSGTQLAMQNLMSVGTASIMKPPIEGVEMVARYRALL